MERKRYTVSDVNLARFYQLPKFLFDGELKSLSNDARVLYALLRDRHDLSLKNEWVNEEGEVYLIFPREEMQEMLGLSENTVIKEVKRLKEHGLIEEERQGLGRPNRIYLLFFSTDKDYSRVKKSEDQEPQILRVRTVNFADQEPQNFSLINNTNSNNTYQLCRKATAFRHVDIRHSLFSRLPCIRCSFVI